MRLQKSVGCVSVATVTFNGEVTPQGNVCTESDTQTDGKKPRRIDACGIADVGFALLTSEPDGGVISFRLRPL
jgi:hypothetical protein